MPTKVEIPTGTRMYVCYGNNFKFIGAYDGTGEKIEKFKDINNQPPFAVSDKTGWPTPSEEGDPSYCYYANGKLYCIGT